LINLGIGDLRHRTYIGGSWDTNRDTNRDRNWDTETGTPTETRTTRVNWDNKGNWDSEGNWELGTGETGTGSAMCNKTISQLSQLGNFVFASLLGICVNRRFDARYTVDRRPSVHR